MHGTRWFGIVLLAWVLVAENAAACEYGGYGVLEIQDTGIGASPGAIGDVSYTVKRGTGPKSDGCEQSFTSCDDIGSIALHFEPAKDEDTASSAVGYRIRVVDGTAPESLDLPAEPMLASAGEGEGEGTLSLYFIDGSTDAQESLGFSIRITPVDADGNEGPESDPIRIRDAGSDGCGVAAGRSSHAPSVVFLVMTLALALRRRF